MRSALAVALASSAIAGCSLIYNPSNLPGPPGEAGIDGSPDAPPDAPPDAEIILDADPTMLALDRIAPSTIDEGQGDGGSRPALLVIGGHQIIDNNTRVEIIADSGTALLDVGAPVVANNGNWIAVLVTAHVDPALGKGASRALTVKVTQTLPPEAGGGNKTGSLSGKLTLVGYNELDSLADLPMVGGKVNSPMLDAMYSKVDLSGMAIPKLGGSDRAIVRSVSQIKLGNLDATGADGAGATVAGEAGGCGGGGPGASSPCVSIGGGGGMTSALLGIGGGGGGGFAANGGVGDGMGGGSGGIQTGDELIVTYGGFNGVKENRAGGGGGGGPTLLLVAGGGGAASGGSIELTAGGNLSVGTITANGGNGKGGGLAGGGGGGAGGLVMLRAGGTLAAGTISVKGGSAGGGASSGGVGSDGRVRWDVETGTAPTVAPGTRTVHRGPSFMLTTQVFRTTDPTMTVVGTAGDRFDVSVENEGMVYAGGNTMIAGNGMGVFSPPLHQGLNHVCILLEGGKPRTSEAEKCVDVAFLP
jgi:hypothetical protein